MAKSKNKSEKIFITGGLGFIGSFLCKRFIDAGDSVVVYDALRSFVSPLVDPHYASYIRHRFKKLEGKIEVVQGDIENYAKLRDTLRGVKPDRVVHLAGLPISDISDQYPHEAVNSIYNGAHNMLDAVKDLGIKRFVLISSSMVYGNFQYKPCDEKHPTDPTGVYGASKLASEVMTRMYAKRYKFPFTIIRPSAVYGPTDCNRRVIEIFIDNAMNGKPIVLHDGGNGELDFTYVEDTADGMFLATKKEEAKNEVFNITRGQRRSLKELAGIIKRHFTRAKIVEKSISSETRRPSRGTLDVTKAKTMLGYRPRVSLEEGIKKYISFLKHL